MKRILPSILILIVVPIICAFSPENQNIDRSKLVDSILLENPAFIPETIFVTNGWPELKMNNNIVDCIMEKHLHERLDKFKPGSRIIVSVHKYKYRDDSLYEFLLVSPLEPTVLNIDADSVTNIIGYAEYGNIVLLFSDDFKNQADTIDFNLRLFRLKLTKRVASERWTWTYIANDSVVKIIPRDYFYETPWMRKSIINAIEKMDEHKF